MPWGLLPPERPSYRWSSPLVGVAVVYHRLSEGQLVAVVRSALSLEERHSVIQTPALVSPLEQSARVTCCRKGVMIGLTDE